ncbi:hypothetical protein PAAG_12642 [Paracoccidioides lutzii Pb01]|uniref:Transcription initiation factor TFIID subunit 4 n=1 Tax=Paracoccidioides lutzii (strain ATCC MYA-826 / Pb01) TaxID=502779 RepID=A0A0A2UZP4_PARBA|nr:hypothetical protein PAAG_12642 [Paracoccidioides lutzii Pb01]KGQ00693.1 hypothetical protein PAAG_12642 [Paracoccidioides lutzii Pb01]
MAQTQSQQFASQSFTPPVSTPSPGAPSPVSGIAPPSKRQRFSPLPQSQSPYESPSFGTLQPPHTGSSVNVSFANGTSTPAMNAPPVPGSMGPPSRPVEKATDTAELTDVLASSGIDVRERRIFNPCIWTGSALPSNPPRYRQFHTPSLLTNQRYPLNPPPSRPRRAAAEDERLRQDTASSRRMQYPLQAPFLSTSLLEERIQKRTYDLGVRVPAHGVYRPYPGRAAGPVEVTGPDGSSVVRTGKALLTQDAPLGDILSLVTLACEERLRSVVDHSYALAINRRANSHGVVPLEWSDMAVALTPPSAKADGTSTKEATPTAATPKRPLPNDVAKDDEPFNKKQMPIVNIIAKRSRSLVEKDISFEEERASKRTRRNADAILGGDSSRAGSVGLGTPGTATPTGQLSERIMEERKATKKDTKKADNKVTEAVQHQQSVETARMATNNLTSGVRFGGKKKTYSWLTNSSPATVRSVSTPSRASVSAAATAGTPTPRPTGVAVTGPSRLTGKRMGDWRESDKERGAGVQIRDILFVLEVDGKGLKHLQKAYSKESKEDNDKSER